MLFVMRTRNGMTKTLANRLAKSSTGSADLWLTVEGPYGGSTDTEQFHEILLVAGGSGISHVMSSAFLSSSLSLSSFR
jgi:NAD(P)H-flavin reductase